MVDGFQLCKFFFQKEFCFFADGGFGGFPFGLEVGEIFFVFRDHAVEAGLVEGDVRELLVVGAPGLGLGDGCFGFGSIGPGFGRAGVSGQG